MSHKVSALNVNFEDKQVWQIIVIFYFHIILPNLKIYLINFDKFKNSNIFPNWNIGSTQSSHLTFSPHLKLGSTRLDVYKNIKVGFFSQLEDDSLFFFFVFEPLFGTKLSLVFLHFLKCFSVDRLSHCVSWINKRKKNDKVETTHIFWVQKEVKTNCWANPGKLEYKQNHQCSNLFMQ